LECIPFLPSSQTKVVSAHPNLIPALQVKSELAWPLRCRIHLREGDQPVLFSVFVITVTDVGRVWLPPQHATPQCVVASFGAAAEA
jgi:hypothetical protein